jgi:hypothetical protein
MRFDFSHNEKYLAIYFLFDYEYFYLCKFENDMETDIFIEREIGQHCLEKMLSTKLLTEFEISAFKISSQGYLFIIDCTTELLYRSRLTIDDLMN